MIRLVREQRIKLILAGVALLTLVSIGGRSYAQMRDVERWERAERRLERRVDELQKAHDTLQLNIEIRLTKIETQLSNGMWMLSALFGIFGMYLVALIGRGAAAWLNERRTANGGKSA